VQEAGVFLLILGTVALVSATEGISWLTLLFSLAAIALRASGARFSTNLGCALLVALAGAAPVYWYFLRAVADLSIKDFLLAILMIFLLSAQTGRDFAAVSSYCIWILLASLFPSSGPQHWFLLGLLFAWFLFVQCLNELRRSREANPAWKGPEGWTVLRPMAGFLFLVLAGIGALSLGLYFLLPRNPLRAYQFQFQPLHRLVGFSNSVRIGEIGELQKDRTPAFRVRFLEGVAPPLVRWRGAALADFNGHTWMNNLETWNEFSQNGRINVASDEQRRLPGHRLFYEVQSLAAMDRVVLTAGVPEYVYLPEGRLRMNGEGGLRQIALEPALPSYSLAAWPGPGGGLEVHPPASDVTLRLSAERKARYLGLPKLHPRIAELAASVTGSWVGDMAKAQAVEEHLRANYAYSLQANIGHRNPLVDFLFVAKAGHCEYFASAMAVMLRTVGIPTRVVTGFYSALPEPVEEWYVIRSTDAHSWVEVWIEGRGWLVFDPTPPGGGRESGNRIAQWFRRMEDKMLVLSEEWMGGAAGLRRPSLPSFSFDWRSAVVYLAGAASLAALLWALWQWMPARPAATGEATRLYLRFLRAAGISRRDFQTVRELPASHAAIWRAYERARFAGDAASLAALRQLVRDAEGARRRAR
jgi:hypothetical protein